MGLTYVDGFVSSNGTKEPVTFLVDSGATYTVLPQAVWQQMGLKPKRTVSCSLADGTRLERSVSECMISLEQGESHTPVILGEESDEALLGVVTLEILGLGLNPFERTLQQMRVLL